MSEAASPFSFDTPAGWCFGWFHPPAAPARGLVVVLCPPLGHEAICSYPTQVQLARHLAGQGFPVLRFDYHGTGDADGHGRLPARVPAWIDSVLAAVGQARRLAGTTQVALAGIRLGGTLALEAAARLDGGVDSLLLWAPCASGKAFVRELRAAGTQDAEGALHALGEHYTAETLHDLQALDAKHLARAPARRALVIGRDDLPGEGPLPRVLRGLGVDVQARVLPGFAAMVGEPRAGVLDGPTLQALTDWLGGSAAAAPATGGAPPAPLPAPAPRFTDGVRETVLRFGAEGRLCGVLAEPHHAAAGTPHRDAAVLLLNVGGNYRIGPHRFYVTAARTLAAAGWRVLRLDLAGIGDSPPAPGQPWANLYDKDSAGDVRAAIDALAARGCSDVTLMGICSGAYVAFQTALVEPRVGSLVLMNARLLDWTPGRPGDSWQDAMQQYAKSTDYYRRSLFKPEVWRRLLRGQVDVPLIARRFLALTLARARRLLATDDSHDGLRHRMQRLCRRGVGVLTLVSDADDGRDYVEFHFGAGGRRMRAGQAFRMAYVQDADHTFSRPGNQAQVLSELLRHLEQHHPPTAGHPAAARYNHGLACRSSSVGRAAHS